MTKREIMVRAHEIARTLEGDYFLFRPKTALLRRDLSDF